MGFVETTTINWLRGPTIGRETLLDLQEHAFDALIQATRVTAGAPVSQGR
ncbi:hypothetical protein ACFYUK_47035 [Nonomuraea wenchangensis]